MKNGYVRFGQFLSFIAGALVGNADFQGKWYVSASLLLVGIATDFVAINHIEKGIKEITEKSA